jgi:heme A synthase
VWWSAMRARVRDLVRTSAWIILIITFMQMALGIATLLNQAPILLSALHQLTALALLSAALWHAFKMRQSWLGHSLRIGVGLPALGELKGNRNA